MELWFTVLAIVVAGIFLAQRLVALPEYLRDNRGNILDPKGSSPLKNFVGFCLARIAKRREAASSSQPSFEEIEGFHSPEIHPFWNESFYFNGCEASSKDRIVTRVSRHGEGAKAAYVFLLIDSKEHGMLSLEHDDAQIDHKNTNPSACGVKYECVEPMRKWKISFNGKLRKGCAPPQSAAKERSELVDVELSFVYERQTPVFWYMRDDCAETLGKNLSQEPWGFNFLKVCLKRSKNHGHYEDFGSLKGTMKIDNGLAREIDFATFRDHSWDIRRWQTIDSLLILLIAFEEPLKLFGHDFWFLDLTLVSMPGNMSGVARYSTGYLLPKGDNDDGQPILSLVAATSINDVPWRKLEDGSREPMPKTEITLLVRPEPATAAKQKPAMLRVKMDGEIRRLTYYPDNHQFICFEDNLSMQITAIDSHQSIQGFGTRQSGFRVGDFDPSQGGCG